MTYWNFAEALAVILIILSLFYILWGPFRIGKEGTEIKAASYLIMLLLFSAVMTVCLSFLILSRDCVIP
jgi:FtsH-binding integral membrane protein